MARRLDYEKARQRDLGRGGTRVARESPQPRAVYASDKQVADLRDRGYTGPRPRTAADAREVARVLRQLGVTHSAIDALEQLPPDARRVKANALRARMSDQRTRATADGKQSRRILERAYSAFDARLRSLGANGQTPAPKPKSSRPPRRKMTPLLGVTPSQIAALAAVKPELRAALITEYRQRVDARYEEKVERIKASQASPRARGARQRLLFLERARLLESLKVFEG